MRFKPPEAKKVGWKGKGWRSCNDMVVNEYGDVAPPHLRCSRCYRIVTRGQIGIRGACMCGFRKMNPCTELTIPDIVLMTFGLFPLTPWEIKRVRPISTRLGHRLRSYVFQFAG